MKEYPVHNRYCLCDGLTSQIDKLDVFPCLLFMFSMGLDNDIAGNRFSMKILPVRLSDSVFCGRSICFFYYQTR